MPWARLLAYVTGTVRTNAMRPFLPGKVACAGKPAISLTRREPNGDDGILKVTHPNKIEAPPIKAEWKGPPQ